MFMCTKEEDSKTKIKVSLMENNVLRQEQGESAAKKVEVIPLALPSAGPTRLATVIAQEEKDSPKSVNDYMVHQLFRAIYEARISDVRHCLRYVAIRSRHPEDGKTPLIAAIGAADPPSRRLKLMRLLIRQGALVDASDTDFQRDPIAWAAVQGRYDELQFLLDKLEGDVDFYKTDVNGDTYLHLAVLSGRLSVVELVLSKMRHLKLSTDSTDALGLTPYITARRLGYSDIAMALKQYGKASVGKYDDVTFRSPREWSIVGRRERHFASPNPRRRRYLARLAEDEHSQALTTVSAPDLLRISASSPTPSPPSEPIRRVLHRCLDLWSEQHLPTWRLPAAPHNSGTGNAVGGHRGHRQRNRLVPPNRKIRMR